MYLLRVALTIGVFSTMAFAISYNTPDAAVKAYCTFDGEGAAYSSHQLHTRAFNHLQVNPIEAAWDESTIIKDYRIVSVIKKDTKTEVVVQYHVLGTISSDLTLASTPSTEQVVFSVARVGGQWKIDHSELEPHITKAGILGILSAEHSDAATKVQTSPDIQTKNVLLKLDAAIHQIENW